MKKAITFLVIFFSISLSISAQVNLPKRQAGLDSLWGVWNDHNQVDTIRLKAIHKIAWDNYLFSQPDSAYYFAQLEYNFAKSKGLKNQMANALNTQGVSHSLRGNYTSAIDHFTHSLTIKEEIGDKRGIAKFLNNR